MNFYAQFSDSLSDPLGSHCSFPFPPPRFTTALRNSRNIRSNIKTHVYTVVGTNLSSELIEIPKATLLLLYSFFTTRLEADKWAAVKQTERWFAIVLNRKLIKDKLSPGGTIPASRKRKTSLRWKGKGYVEFSMRFHRVRSVKRRDNRVEQTLRGGLEEEGGDLWRKNVWQRGATGQGRVLFSIYPSPTQPRLFRGIGSQRNTRGGCSRSISRGTCLGFLPGPSLPRDTSRFLL